VTRAVAVVPHTHWDREWYAAFPTFRLRLVDLLDDLLARLEADPSYARFLLDGQLAMVDDYLALRPEAEDRLRRLAASGRVAVGPWYVLPDEFCVSGETLVRNLQLGLERAAAFGGAMPVGYLPDMFGHVAQMPQVLRLAGLEHAVVWRGVPAAVDRTAFWWEAPDGTRVRAEYLWSGYGNGQQVEGDAKELVQRVRAHEAELGEALLDGLLFMNGSDHQEPQPWLGRVVHEANELQDDYRFAVTSLAAYLRDAPTDGLPVWQGELRSGARANLLMGVASNRVDVKQAAARTERALERLAEPLCALFLPPAQWPDALLRAAWFEVVRNAAHDSICACSVDEVVDAVLHRFAEARQVAEGLTQRAVAALASSLAGPGVVVVNPSARTRSGYVEMTLPGDGELDGAQVLSARPATRVDLALAGSALVTLLHQTRNRQLDANTFLNGATVDDEGDHIDLTLRAGFRPVGDFDFEAIRAALLARVEAQPDVEVRLHVEQEASRKVLLRAEEVPGFGWSAWAPRPPGVEPVTVDGGAMANGLVRVEVDPADGTFSIGGHGGLGRLVDDGDAGDTYNYSPPAPTRSRCACWSEARCAPASRSRAATRGPSAWRAAPGWAAGRWRSRPSSTCGPANAWSASRRRSTTSAATTACGRGSRCRSRQRGRRRNARSQSSSAASRPRAARRSTGCRRSRLAGSCRPAGSRSCTRDSWSTRWSTAAAPWPSRSCGRPGCCHGWC
jgi:mannosylglycerate hydrolase